ncbi:VOC family protein [Enorma shizhengliae]
MRIEHAALYVNDLEGARAFFETYFGAVPNDGYHNPKTGLRTYFLTFGNHRLGMRERGSRRCLF